MWFECGAVHGAEVRPAFEKGLSGNGNFYFL